MKPAAVGARYAHCLAMARRRGAVDVVGKGGERRSCGGKLLGPGWKRLLFVVDDVVGEAVMQHAYERLNRLRCAAA